MPGKLHCITLGVKVSESVSKSTQKHPMLLCLYLIHCIYCTVQILIIKFSKPGKHDPQTNLVLS